MDPPMVIRFALDEGIHYRGMHARAFVRMLVNVLVK